MIPITARFQSKILIMIFGSVGFSALIFQTIFSGNPEYAWTAHMAAPIIGGSFSGMMGLGTWRTFPIQINVFIHQTQFDIIRLRNEQYSNPLSRNKLRQRIHKYEWKICNADFHWNAIYWSFDCQACGILNGNAVLSMVSF